MTDRQGGGVTDAITLEVAGRVYGGCTQFRVSRALDKLASDFDIAITERWQAGQAAWQVQKFQPCTVRIGQDLVLTGYIDTVLPHYDAHGHAVRIAGRSRTEDLIDCTPDIKGGQFSGYTLGQVAGAVCALFGIQCVVQTPAADAFVDATMERCETAFTFLERLCRLSGVLACDDAQGRLVLTTAGSTRAAGHLREGGNVLAASATLSGHKQFSLYVVKGQTALGAGSSAKAAGGINLAALAGPGPSGGTAATPARVAPVSVGQRAVATDPTVPRYRPHVTLAESQRDAAGMQVRANWQRSYAFGRATKAEATLQGFRQDDGALWQVNQLVPVTSPFLQIDQDLLVVETHFSQDSQSGSLTRLGVGPIEGYTPDPGEVKPHKARGGRHGRGKGAKAFGGDLSALAHS